MKEQHPPCPAVELPPLPEPVAFGSYTSCPRCSPYKAPIYKAEQMREYARAALAACVTAQPTSAAPAQPRFDDDWAPNPNDDQGAAPAAAGMPQPVALTDAQIQSAVFAVLRKWNTERAWDRYTRETGPYDITELRPEVLEIIRAVLAVATPPTPASEVAQDAARLDWLEANWGAWCGSDMPGMFHGTDWNARKWIDAKTLRAAIDAALQGERHGD
jgi:hypothetical protein